MEKKIEDFNSLMEEFIERMHELTTDEKSIMLFSLIGSFKGRVGTKMEYGDGTLSPDEIIQIFSESIGYAEKYGKK